MTTPAGMLTSALTLLYFGPKIYKSNIVQASVIKPAKGLVSKFRTPTATPSAPGSPSPLKAPKTPKLYEKTSLDLTLPKDNVLRDMEPKSPVHKYFREVVQSELKSKGATPLQELKCKQLGDQFDLGKLSREEYFRKIFLISEGRFTFTARIKNLFSGSLWAKIRQPISRVAQAPL